MTFFEMANRLVGGLLPDSLVNKSAQSKFFYTNELNRKIVDRRIGDLGVYSGMNKSQVIEQTLIGSLLPPDGSTASEYVNRVLLGEIYVRRPNSRRLEPESYGIKDALHDIFVRNCNGTSEAIHDDLKPLVAFVREILPKCGAYFVIDGDPIGLRRFACGKMLNWLNMVRREEGLSELPDIPGVGNTSMYGDDYYLSRLAAPDPEILPFNYVLRVLEKWDTCKSWASTYEFLGAFLDVLEPWHDSPYDRITFQKACIEVMAPWDEADDGKSVEGIEAEAVSFDG